MTDVPTDVRRAWDWATEALVTALADRGCHRVLHELFRAGEETDLQRKHAAICKAADVDRFRSEHLHLWIALRDLADAALVLDDEEAADPSFENIARCLNAVECRDDIVDDWMWDQVTPRIAVGRRRFMGG